jgi:hypothetical protein
LVKDRGDNPDSPHASYKLFLHGLYQRLRLSAVMPTTTMASSLGSSGSPLPKRTRQVAVLLIVSHISLLLLEFPPLISRRQNRLSCFPR